MSSIFGVVQLPKLDLSREGFEKIASYTNWWNADTLSIHQNQTIAFGIAGLDDNPNDKPVIFSDALSGCTISADVRLDYRNEIIEKLSLDQTYTDTQIVLYAYLKYKEKCLDYILGAFAFVIWDSEKQQIFMARDHIGVKPLNYYYKDDLFLFGTQKKSILHYPELSFQLDWNHIIQRAEDRKFHPFDTEYLDIKRVPPAHYIIIHKEKLDIKRYWELDITKTIKYEKDEDYVQRFLKLFEQAVETRMLSSKNLGAHVSGGFDSGAIVTMGQRIANLKNTPLHTLAYTRPLHEIEQNPEKIDESDYVDDVIEHAGVSIVHKVHEVIERSRKEKLIYEAQICDGIQHANKVNNEFEILKTAQDNNINVILSGFPGDELISYHYYSYYLDYLDNKKYRRFFFGKFPMSKKNRLKFFIFRYLKNSRSSFAKFFSNKIKDRQERRLYNKHLHNNYFLKYNVEKPIMAINSALFFEHINDPFLLIHNSTRAEQKHKISFWPVHYRMESEHLVGLYNKLSFRYPLSDIRLLQYVISLPLEQRWDGKTHRLFFKKVCKQLLPASIMNRNKPKGIVKPMLQNYKSPKDSSLLELWEEFQQDKLVPQFFDQDKVEKYLKTGYNYNSLNKYLIVASLFQKFNLKV